MMTTPNSTISGKKLHIFLILLILFLLCLLSVPLILINNGMIDFDLNELSYKDILTVAFTEKLKNEGKETSFDCLKYAQATNLMVVDANATCPTDYFICRTQCNQAEKICIEPGFRCDEEFDCPDKSDEYDCVYYGILKDLFTQLPLNSTTIEQGSCRSFNESPPIPKNCTKEQLENDQCPCDLEDDQVIVCVNSSQSSIPNNLKESVYKIRMTDNFIENIDNVRWPKDLMRLVLDKNRIKHIGPGAFEKAPYLSQVYLQDNQIASIDSNAFKNMHCLRTIQLDNNNLTTFDTRILIHTPAIRKLQLTGNNINLPHDTNFSLSPMIEEVFLDYNNITIIKSHWMSHSPSLRWVVLHHNKIELVEERAFEGDISLKQLDLSYNKIKFITGFTLAKESGLILEALYLGSNPIKTLPLDAFNRTLSLQSLDLSDIHFDELNMRTFASLKKLDFIYFSEFVHCQQLKNVTYARVCRPNTDGVSSDKKLLAFPTLKYAVWIVAFICSVSNVFVFIWRSVSPHEDRTMSLFVKNLSIADLMMGIYLTVIAFRDSYFGRYFGRHAMEWMSSPTCTAIGILAILSSELSVFILAIITIERYRSIMSIEPINQKEQKKRAKIHLALAWFLALAIAFYPALDWNSGELVNYATNGLCLPLHIDGKRTPGWKYSAFVYVGLNFLVVILIVYMYVRMYLMIMGTKKASKPALIRDAEKREDTILAVRFFFIVLTGCLCLIPIVVIKVMALASIDIPSYIYGWLVVFIIPINSALNPIVYTLAAKTSLRDAIYRTLGCICYKIDLIMAQCCLFKTIYGKNNNLTASIHHRSSSTASTTVDSTSSLINQKRRNTGSISTTCDTYHSSIASLSKPSLESAITQLNITCTISITGNNEISSNSSSSSSRSNNSNNYNNQSQDNTTSEGSNLKFLPPPPPYTH